MGHLLKYGLTSVLVLLSSVAYTADWELLPDLNSDVEYVGGNWVVTHWEIKEYHGWAPDPVRYRPAIVCVNGFYIPFEYEDMKDEYGNKLTVGLVKFFNKAGTITVVKHIKEWNTFSTWIEAIPEKIQEQ
jgi:hypothetical protein